MAVLVTGGAGYIGSVFVEVFSQRGGEVVILDDLYRGHRSAVPDGVPFYEGKAGDAELVRSIAERHTFEACVHFGALTYVGESVTEPARYFQNNFCQAAALFEALVKAGVKQFVFSSTAAVYGEPAQVPIPETHPQRPVNPYGWSKFFVERLLESFDRAYGARFVALRYFNAAGATGQRGEDHRPETHLVPLVLQTALGQRPDVSVFGGDYPTPDGAAIRDYVHVADLADAHLKALEYLRRGGGSQCLNLGTGRGYSVLEVLETARRVTGRPIPAKMAPRRAGDPARLVAQADLAREVLGWKPACSDLESIIRSAWDWHRGHPNGYNDGRE